MIDPDLKYTDYIVLVAAALREYPDWRQGQAFFNTLCEVHPVLAERVRGTVVDPFYSDAILPEFLRHIESLWEETR